MAKNLIMIIQVKIPKGPHLFLQHICFGINNNYLSAVARVNSELMNISRRKEFKGSSVW